MTFLCTNVFRSTYFLITQVIFIIAHIAFFIHGFFPIIFWSNEIAPVLKEGKESICIQSLALNNQIVSHHLKFLFAIVQKTWDELEGILNSQL